MDQKKTSDNYLSLDERLSSGHAEFPSEHLVRIEKVKKLRARGIEPWPQAIPVTQQIETIIHTFSENGTEEYSIAGRLTGIRFHGRTAFAHLQDITGKIQIYFREDSMGKEQFNLFHDYIDTGDILWVKGTIFKTKTAEITLRVISFLLLSKCLYPLPEKFHGLVDIETKYRQRYLDLITDDAVKQKFIKRSQIISSIRTFLDDQGYIEVETPMLHPIAGGAAARPFITHHNALKDDFYLRIAPELYLKRLVVGGFERVYEINRNFRNEGISTRHNPEFTMLELYTGHQNYHFSMNLVESVIRHAANKIGVDTKAVIYGDIIIDFSKPFERISMRKSISTLLNIAEHMLEKDKIDATIQQQGLLAKPEASYGEKLLLFFEKYVEPTLIQPTFITDYPVDISPLAKRDPQNPDFAPRFELFVAGMELSNGYNELNDPFEQAERFNEQMLSYSAGNEEAHLFDQEYITALEYGLIPTTGLGIGIDRLVMLLTNTPSIKEVILFPTLKKK